MNFPTITANGSVVFTDAADAHAKHNAAGARLALYYAAKDDSAGMNDRERDALSLAIQAAKSVQDMAQTYLSIVECDASDC